MKFRNYHKTRYEYKRWPLWRMDKNISYLLKSFDHVSKPWTHADANYYQLLSDYLSKATWRKQHLESCLRLSAVGDMMWIRSGWSSALSTQVYNQLASADITFANLETPMVSAKPVPKWTYETLHYNSPSEYFAQWHKMKLESKNVFSICNNHALDQGMDGLQATREAVLTGDNFFCLGGTLTGEESCLVEHNGIRIACLASTFGINHLALNNNLSPQGIPLIQFGNPMQQPDWNFLSKWIQEVKQKNVDLIVFMPHWGYEYEYWPDALMRQHAHKLIELGFDIILGSSPHVLQPIEIVSINGWDNNCPTQIVRPGKSKFGLIAYSLGNFLTIMPTLPCKVGIILHIDLTKKDNDDLELVNLSIIPTYSERGLGDHWIDARTVSLDELRKEQYISANAHIKKIFGTLYQS